jgi:NAD(P)-dependent dehydrogenase (short-subunit alcohol dehydrogenase family)
MEKKNDTTTPTCSAAAPVSQLSTLTCSTRINADHRFVGKVIVITGAGGQLGREGCLYWAARGARLAALDVSEEALQETARALQQQADKNSNNFDFVSYACDVTSEEQVAAVLDAIVATYGHIDYLWNNAGCQGQIRPILEQSAADFAKVMNVNVTGQFIVLQQTARHMISKGGMKGGSIVNTASVAGMRGTPAMVAYASSKAAVMTMTVCSAKELAVHNIRVNAISPALIGPGTLWERYVCTKREKMLLS